MRASASATRKIEGGSAQEIQRRFEAAASDLDPSGVREALALGADPNASDEEGEPLLCRIVTWICSSPGERSNGEEVAALLAAAGADMNRVNDEGWSGLHIACGFGQERLARVLMEGGARVDLEDKKGETPAHFIGRVESADNGVSLGLALAERGAVFSNRNHSGQSAMDTAREAGLEELAEAMSSWDESRELKGLLPRRSGKRGPAL